MTDKHIFITCIDSSMIEVFSLLRSRQGDTQGIFSMKRMICRMQQAAKLYQDDNQRSQRSNKLFMPVDQNVLVDIQNRKISHNNIKTGSM